MIAYTMETLAEYPDLHELVMSVGSESKPRGSSIMEVRPLVLEIMLPAKAIVRRKGFNRSLMYAEQAMYVGGTFSEKLLDEMAPASTRRLFTEFGAYGTRIAAQMSYVVKTLKDDPDSRQAIARVGHPKDLELNRTGLAQEMPCTESYQYFIRDHAMELHVKMRSWDLVWGLSYDVPAAAMLQWVMAQAFDMQMGRLVFVASNAHIYEQHWDIASLELDEETPTELIDLNVGPDPRAGTDPMQRYQSSMRDARTAISAQEAHDYSDTPISWERALETWRARVAK